jgi:hypothetical protein
MHEVTAGYLPSHDRYDHVSLETLGVLNQAHEPCGRGFLHLRHILGFCRGGGRGAKYRSARVGNAAGRQPETTGALLDGRHHAIAGQAANLPRLKVSMRLKSSRRLWNPYGQELKFPHIVRIVLISKGRADITPTSFGGSPLRLDVGAPVVECLDVATVPSDRQVPRVRADGTTLLVEPVLIGKRETINISVLVDGESPGLSRPQQSLIDVDIRQWDPASENARLQSRLVIILMLLLIAGILGLPGALHGIIAFFNSL